MKKALLFLLLVLALFSACKKNSPEEELPERYLQFKVNGNKIIYTIGGVETWVDPKAYVARGFSDENESEISVGLHYDGDIILNKEYAVPEYDVYIYYTDADGVSYGNYGGTDLPASITIKEEAPSYYSGTFSGTLKTGSGTTISITEGRFRLSRDM